MNNSPVRSFAATSLLTALLLLGACGQETEKSGVTKSSLATSPTPKLGPSGAAKAASAFSAAASAEVDVSSSERVMSGQPASGRLSAGDPVTSDGSHYDYWIYEASSREEVRIALSSDEFDTYMMLGSGFGGEGLDMITDNDDGGDGTNSLIYATLEPGTYTIMASSYGAGETGDYTLAVELAGSEGSVGGATGGGGALSAGGQYSGRLESSDEVMGVDGSFVDRWTYTGQAGEIITVTMRSEDFDALLLAAEAVGDDFDFLGEDDDGGGGLDAQMEFELPYTGTFLILANAFDAGAMGDYTLEVDIRAVTADWEDRYPGGGDPLGKYAVLVGIDDYPGTGSDLRGPVNDALLMRDVLLNRYGFSEQNIVLLLDDEATREGIANAFVRHLGQAGPDGIAVFFYSGHGTQMNENLGLTEPFDPEPDGTDEALYVWGQSRESSIILDDELGFLAEQLQAERTLLIVDACFSGTISRGPAQAKFAAIDLLDVPIRLPKTFIAGEIGNWTASSGADQFSLAELLSQQQRHVLMAASSEAQVSYAIGSWPDRDGPASLYTYYLTQRLTEASGSDTFEDVHARTVRDVVAYYEDDELIDPQDPQLMGRGTDRTLEDFFRRR